MSQQIMLPSNQVRLTNVAVVRMNRGGKRFEVACYRNKIVNYREGTETDLSEVLQTERVFTNVSKGQFANKADLKKCFDTSDEEEICRRILAKGEVQVSDMERSAQLEATTREVASMVSEKCVDPASNRPYTIAQVRDAMKQAGFMVHPTKNVKQQFLDCVRLIQSKDTLSIERAKMELAVVLLDDDGDNGDGGGDESNGTSSRMEHARSLLIDAGITDFRSASSTPTRLVFRSDPSAYRAVESIARETAVHGRLEIVQQSVTEVGDVALGSELERRREAQEQAQARQQEHGEERSRQNASKTTRGAGAAEDAGDGDGIDEVTRRMQSSLAIADDADGGNRAETEGNDRRSQRVAEPPMANSRKAQKAAKRKNKKAQQREALEQMERAEAERIAAENSDGDSMDEAEFSLHAERVANDAADDSGEENDQWSPPVAVPQMANSRKSQKAAQKKSKKAKRREKEEKAEREVRITAEKLRRKERAERLGIDEDQDETGGAGTSSNGGGAVEEGEGGEMKRCNTCGVMIRTSEYRAHFRSDWHRYNLKLKMQGVSPVSEREFMLCDSDAFFD